MARSSLVHYLLALLLALLGDASEQYDSLGSTISIRGRAPRLHHKSTLMPRQQTILAYDAVDQTQQDANFASYSSAGYRIVTLDVSGDPSAPQFSAVWILRSGPSWQAQGTTNETILRNFINTWEAQGYVLTQIAATGSLGNTFFSAVMEQISIGSYVFWDMPSGPSTTPGTFQWYNAQARKNAQTLRSFAVYGSGTSLYYGAVWHNDPARSKFHVHTPDEVTPFDTLNAEELSLPNFRPYYISQTSDNQLVSAYIDNYIGTYVSYQAMDQASYHSYYSAQAANGFYPINLQTGGSGVNTRYAAIFASTDIPASRLFTANDTLLGVPTAEAALKTFMIESAVRSAQLTIYKNGVEKHVGAYDYAENANRRPTTTGDRYLLAGLSEIFVAAAMQYCYDNNLLAKNTIAYSVLSFSNPLDQRSDTITVQQLLDHKGGYAWTSTGDPVTSTDPTYHMREVATALNLDHAITAHDMAFYMYTRIRLDSDPGLLYHDSSYGYVLLTLLIEAVTKTAFMTFLTTNIVTPSALTIGQYPTEAPSGAILWPPLLTHPDDDGLGLSALIPSFTIPIPYVYGGDGMIKEVAVGSAGLSGSATDVATFISTHAVQGVGPRAAGKSRVSSNAGGTAYAESREDGVDWAFTMNTREFLNGAVGDPLGDLVKAVNAAIDAAGL